jgi:hypothetical protein
MDPRHLSTDQESDDHPSPTDLRRSEAPLNSNVAVNQPAFPWNTRPFQPQTNINGGTFINENVNHVEDAGE